MPRHRAAATSEVPPTLRLPTASSSPRETFRSDEAFTRVLLHEMTHSTGHPSALARELDTRFGSPPMLRKSWSRNLEACFFPQTSVSRAPIWRASSTRTTSPICNLG